MKTKMKRLRILWRWSKRSSRLSFATQRKMILVNSIIDLLTRYWTKGRNFLSEKLLLVKMHFQVILTESWLSDTKIIDGTAANLSRINSASGCAGNTKRRIIAAQNWQNKDIQNKASLVKKEANTLRKLKSAIPEHLPQPSKSPEKSVESVSNYEVSQKFKPLIKDKIPHFPLNQMISQSKDQRELKYVTTKVCSLQPIKADKRHEQLIQEIDMCKQKFELENENSFSKKNKQQLTFSSFYQSNNGFYPTRGKFWNKYGCSALECFQSIIQVVGIVTPMLSNRPATAKLNDSHHISREKKTPLEEFLEMKRALWLKKTSDLVSSETKTQVTALKERETNTSRRVQTRFKGKV